MLTFCVPDQHFVQQILTFFQMLNWVVKKLRTVHQKEQKLKRKHGCGSLLIFSKFEEKKLF
jgi:hypothetical protein